MASDNNATLIARLQSKAERSKNFLEKQSAVEIGRKQQYGEDGKQLSPLVAGGKAPLPSGANIEKADLGNDLVKRLKREKKERQKKLEEY